nr:hypothetical protein [Kibdelosporangium sp. MJ126-NF4]
MGRPTKIVVASTLGLTHGLVSLMYAMIAPLFRNGPSNVSVLLLQLVVGVLIIVASVLIVKGRGRVFFQLVFWLQVANAVVCALVAFPAGLGALPFMIPLPLTGMLLLHQPDSKWYLGVR